jgi:hypothetical protein
LTWKGAAIQRGLEPGNRKIAIVKTVTRQLLVKALRTGKYLRVSYSNLLSVWKLAMAL